MTVYSATHGYQRPGKRFSLRHLQRVPEMLRLDARLLRALGKVLLVLLPLLLVINLSIAASISSFDRSMVALGDQRHQLMDRNIVLLATKARLYAPTSIERLAAERFALYRAEQDQIGKFNRREGTFSYN
jgi:hypothetical protein